MKTIKNHFFIIFCIVPTLCWGYSCQDGKIAATVTNNTSYPVTMMFWKDKGGNEQNGEVTFTGGQQQTTKIFANGGTTGIWYHPYQNLDGEVYLDQLGYQPIAASYDPSFGTNGSGNGGTNCSAALTGTSPVSSKIATPIGDYCFTLSHDSDLNIFINPSPCP